jgi:hypothetical protein
MRHDGKESNPPELKFLLSALFYLFSLSLVFIVPKMALLLNDTFLPPQHRPLRFLLIGIFTLIFGGYWLLLYRLRDSRIDVTAPGREQLYFWAGIASVFTVLLWTQAVLSSDVYEYSMRGRMFAVYGMNPYTHAPCEVSGDMFYDLIFWKKTPECYGPLWVLLGSVHTLFFKGAVLLTGFMHKAWLFLFYAGACYYFMAIAKELKIREPGFWLAAFMANPLVIIMTVVDGHNEIVMVFFMLISVYMALKDRFFWAVIMLALAVCVKFTYVITAPFLFLYMLFFGRKKSFAGRLSEIALGAAGAVLIAALLWVPFGLEGVRAIVKYYSDLSTLLWPDSIPYAVWAALGFAKKDVSLASVASVFTAAFVLFYIGYLAAFLKGCRNDRRLLPESIAMVLLALLFANGTPFQPWYLLWAMPFLLLSRLKTRYLLSLLLSYFLIMTFWKRMSVLAVPMFVAYFSILAARGRYPVMNRIFMIEEGS